MKFIQKILPSTKVKEDVIFSYTQPSSLQPIQLYELSLTSIMKHKILSLRKQKKHLHITRDKKKLTLIIPYRHRKEHLDQFLPAIKQRLTEQEIHYEIIIAEQDDTNIFNKAKLMNIAVLHASDASEYFVFHDVDLLPFNIDYNYCNHTLKLFNYIKEGSHYKKYGQTIFGGAILTPKEIFFDINGFSNNYWQWGKEDDDFLLRHLIKGYIPLFDADGKLIALPHLPSITRDISGKYVAQKKVLKENKRLYHTNKILFSQLKRGLYEQNKDGVNTVSNYTVLSKQEEERVIRLKIHLNA